MSERSPLGLDRVVAMTFSVAIAIGVVAIVAMLLAALAFTNGTIISIPFLATFDGLRETRISPTVTVTGSWIAAGIATAILALPLCIAALRINRNEES
ncbi:hypothetical protein FB472_1846 [Rhodoglobus vestalii]|uniref:Uncharacterized protein n=1 Tax=Rhodoglobus vestalii TaxID=193384 RepID=A0A8H2PYZ9_9MICO|nr:hypothetical protein [Rhodoglobus vestalii]TQO20228.1 hypothetical protein FB472_1846 [Rhodoglobus vestalii]